MIHTWHSPGVLVNLFWATILVSESSQAPEVKSAQLLVVLKGEAETLEARQTERKREKVGWCIIENRYLTQMLSFPLLTCHILGPLYICTLLLYLNSMSLTEKLESFNSQQSLCGQYLKTSLSFFRNTQWLMLCLFCDVISSLCVP